MCDYDPTYGCSFPYVNKINETGCRTTYGEYIGLPYYLYHGFFCSLSIIIFLCVMAKNIMIHYENRSFATMKFKKLFLLILWFMAFCLFIQGIDPQGYNGTIPQMVEELFSNFCTILGLILVITLVLMFGKVLQKIPDPKWIATFWTISIIISIVLGVVFSIYQINDNRHVYRGAKLIVFSVILLIISIVVTWYMNNMIIIFAIHQQDSYEVTEIKYRIVMYLYLYDMFALFLIIYQFSTGIVSLIQGDNKLRPKLSSEQIVFPLTQFIGILFGLMYTNKIANRYNQQFDFASAHPVPSIPVQSI